MTYETCGLPLPIAIGVGDPEAGVQDQRNSLVLFRKRAFDAHSENFFVGRAGFEPAKVKTNRFTACPRWPLEYLPLPSNY